MRLEFPHNHAYIITPTVQIVILTADLQDISPLPKTLGKGFLRVSTRVVN